MADYIPQGDSEFNVWQAAFVTYANANLAALGLVAADMLQVTTAQTTWAANYTAHIAAQNAAETAAQSKRDAREAYVTAIRVLAGRLQASPSVSDPERAGLGITVPDREPTPIGPPTTRPVLQVDTSQRLKIGVAFSDEGTPTSEAKPAGVMGCEVWVKVGGTPPTDLDDCVFLALDTRTPYSANFDGAQAGQTAHFIGVWVNKKGERGPLSSTVSATVPG